jgi:hypothetical protein
VSRPPSQGPLAALVLCLVGCGDGGPAIEIELRFDAVLQLDQVVVLVSHGDSSRGPLRHPEPPAPLQSGTRLRLLLPANWGDAEVDVVATGLAMGQVGATGRVQVRSRPGEVVSGQLTLRGSDFGVDNLPRGALPP